MNIEDKTVSRKGAKKRKDAKAIQKAAFVSLRLCVKLLLLFARRRDVHVDLLSSSTSKQASSKSKQCYQYYDHKNHEHSDYARAAASAFFGHEGPPYV